MVILDIYNNRNEDQPKKNNTPNPEIFTVIAIVLCVFACVALFTNGYLFGTVGQAITKFILGVFGYAAYPLFIGAAFFAVMKLMKKKIKLSKKYILAFALMFVTGVLSVHLFTTKNWFSVSEITYGSYLGKCYTEAVRGWTSTTGGGLISGLLVYPLAKSMTVTGASVVFILLFLIATFIACDFLIFKSKRKRRMDVREYRDYPVEDGDSTAAKPQEARPYADYQRPQTQNGSPVRQPAASSDGLSVRPVKRNLYIGTIDERAGGEFETKSKRELKNTDSDKLNLLYGNRAEPKRAEGPQWTKDSAKQMLFGEGKGPVEQSYSSGGSTEGSKSYLEDFEAEPIKDLSSPEAIRNRILTPPSITEMYPNIFHRDNNSQGNASDYDPNRPRKILHDKSGVDYRQISIDEAMKNGGNYAADFTQRRMPSGGQPVRRAGEGYEEYLNKKLPLERPPIVNGEEFTKNVIRDAERVAAPEQRDIVTRPEEITSPTDKVVDFKEISEKYAQKAAKKEEHREQSDPIVNPNRLQPEQIQLPDDSYTKTVKAGEQERPEPTFDERAAQAAAAVRKPPKPKYRYQAPPIDLIERRIMDLDSVNDSFNEKAKILEETLEEFRVPAKVASIVKGPTVTRYELEMPRGIPVKRVLSVADDLAMRLESENGVRIEAPIPGKNRLGIEVPNLKKLMVGLREVLDTQEFYNNRSPIAFAVGKDVAGKNIICDLAKMPHLLVAGSTGAGKSVCLNTLIISLLYKASPDDVRIILIDPKQVEFNTYNEMPHLMLREVISSPEKAISALNWAIIEMERRYTLFKAMNANNLTSYNEKYDPEIDEKLPYIVIIVDELADLMSTNKREVEEKIQRLVQKSRAAGIHLVLATQRPSVDIITGVIKNNLPSRIAFKVVSFMDSKTILDGGGAENLLGAGDMLYRPATAPESVRLQGAFISMNEVENIVRYIKENNRTDFDEAVEMIISKPKNDSFDSDGTEEESRDREDPLFVEALRLVMDTKQASISYLQRKFSVGYARAGKLIDEMETRGYISASDGSKARQVYITPQEFAEKYGELDG